MSGLMIIAGMGLFVYVIGMVVEEFKQDKWRSYNETIHVFAKTHDPHMQTMLLENSWYGLSGEFKGRAISVTSSPAVSIDRSRQFRVEMSVKMPASFAFQIRPFDNWQAIYNYSYEITLYGLFHLTMFPQNLFGKMFTDNPLLADKFLESLDLFLGNRNPNNMVISGEMGQIVVEHDKMVYTIDGLEALLNGLSHLANAIEALPRQKQIMFVDC